MSLRIECPSCRQTFEVGDELRGKTVECGSCERRFKVTDEVVLGEARESRVYPDEAKKKMDMSRFGTTPMQGQIPVQFRTAQYEKAPRGQVMGPVPIGRSFALGAGILIAVLGGGLAWAGSRPGAFLQDVSQEDRLLLFGFLGLISFCLVFWGLIRSRLFGFLLGLLLAAGLVSLVFLLPYHTSVRMNEGEGIVQNDDLKVDVPDFFPGITEKKMSLQEVQELTRWEGVVLPEIAEFGERKVGVVWVRGMEEFHKLEINGYLRQKFNLSADPECRKVREGYLFVLGGTDIDLDELEMAAGQFAKIEQKIPELRLVQTVFRGQAEENDSGSEGNLADMDSEAFYSANFEELTSLDRGRAMAAAKRLASAKPRRLRKDITRQFVNLLDVDQPLGENAMIVKAMTSWSEEGDGADILVLNMAEELRGKGNELPDEFFTFLAKRRPPNSEGIVVETWAKRPGQYEAFLEEYGPGIAPFLIPYLRSEEGAVVGSASRLMGILGGPGEKIALQEALSVTSNSEHKLFIQEAISKIEQR